MRKLAAFFTSLLDLGRPLPGLFFARHKLPPVRYPLPMTETSPELRDIYSVSRLNREGRSANCPWYYDFKDVDPGDEAWEDVAKINPADGRN